MVKCLNIGKNIGKPIYRPISTQNTETSCILDNWLHIDSHSRKTKVIIKNI